MSWLVAFRIVSNGNALLRLSRVVSGPRAWTRRETTRSRLFLSSNNQELEKGKTNLMTSFANSPSIPRL